MGPDVKPPPALPRLVIALGLVSLFTDLASEMIYPLLPLYVAATLGGGTFAIGLIEGVAESTAAIVKLVSGHLSDRATRRKPLVVAGYGLASVARPLVAFAGSWAVVLLIRFADRIGKGIRTSPRDALLADATPADRRGRAYGFHRAMDHAGAVVGPLVATALLAGGLDLGAVFLVAAIPGAVAMGVLVFGVDDPPRPSPAPSTRTPLGRPAPALRRPLGAVALFTLGNASDAFLLLRLGFSGLDPARVALAWSGLHVVKAAATLVGGRLADRLPRRGLIAVGWAVHALAYLGFGLSGEPAILIPTFLVYGLATGLVEPAERAWLADLAEPSARGVAFGWFHATVGFCALPASVVFGVAWKAFGPLAAFGGSAALAVAAVVVLAVGPRGQPRA